MFVYLRVFVRVCVWESVCVCACVCVCEKSEDDVESV